MGVLSSIIANLVVLSSNPKAVEVSNLFMSLQVVKSHVGQNFLLNGGRISIGSNTILGGQNLKLFVSIKAVLH